MINTYVLLQKDHICVYPPSGIIMFWRACESVDHLFSQCDGATFLCFKLFREAGTCWVYLKRCYFLVGWMWGFGDRKET